MGQFQLCALCFVMLTLNVAGTDIAAVLKNIRMVQTEISASGEVGDATSMLSPKPEVAIRRAAAHHDLMRHVTSRDSGTLDRTVAGKETRKSHTIWWGGAKRETNTRTNAKNRPDAAHSEVCDGSPKVCKACDTKTDCWHGFDQKPVDFHATVAGFEITVPSGTPAKDYVVTVWASCKNSGNHWAGFKLLETLDRNTKVSVYLNDKLLRTWTADSKSLTARTIHLWNKEMGKDAQIKIVASRVDVHDSSRITAKIFMMADAPEWVDTCLDRDYCLRKLGDGSNAAFELRNNNRRQYECLQGHPASRLKTECDLWRSCFAEETDATHEADLLKVLKAIFRPRASQTTKTMANTKAARRAARKAAAKKNKKKRRRKGRVSSLGQKEATPMKELLGAISSSNIEDAPSCTDPAAADVESFECECLDEVRNNCAAKGVTDIEECFLAYMCDNVAVCASWKEGACPGGGSSLMHRSSFALESAASATSDQEKKVLVNRSNGSDVMAERSQVSTKVATSGKLDGAVQGKCTSESQ